MKKVAPDWIGTGSSTEEEKVAAANIPWAVRVRPGKSPT
jgi:hypothetical protein